jgi:hypothetical protein
MQFISGMKQAEQAGKSTDNDPTHYILAVSASSWDALSPARQLRPQRPRAKKSVRVPFIASSRASSRASSISFATEDDGGRATPVVGVDFPALPWTSVRSTSSSKRARGSRTASPSLS